MSIEELWRVIHKYENKEPSSVIKTTIYQRGNTTEYKTVETMHCGLCYEEIQSTTTIYGEDKWFSTNYPYYDSNHLKKCKAYNKPWWRRFFP